ncbi:ArnT family glycosyltransferase [Neptunicella marina]|uniref:ArnT family glycosyltransferase n=1 Tax=Neptunicella marina TaxID=2125989 RepID=UPI003BAE1D8D
MKSGQYRDINLFWLLITSLTLIFIGLGLRDPWPADEPRFAHIAQAMVESGQWFFPVRGGELYPDKPPIFMWSIAFFYWITGSLNIAFLLPSALCGLLTVYLVYDIGRRLWDDKTAFIAGLMLVFTLQFTLQAKTAQIDAMVCAWITIGCYGLLRFLLINNAQWRWYWLAFFFMGIGVITKGVGFLPVLMLVPYAIIRYKSPQPHEIPGGVKWLSGLLVMLAAIGLWFVPMLLLVEYHQNPLFELYRDNILFKQTVTRYANSWHHIKPFWYYVVSVIPVFWLPLSFCIPWLIKPWWNAIKQADRRIILPLGWIVLLLLFFSISPGKRGVYILPALPMLCLISAPYLDQLLKAKWPARLLSGFIVVLSVLLVAVAIAGIYGVPKAIKLAEKYDAEPWSMLLAIGACGLCVTLLCLRKSIIYKWIGFISILWAIYSTWGYQLLNPVKTPKNIYQNMAVVVPEGAEVALIKTAEQFLLFTPYKITHFGYHTPQELQLAAAWRWQQTNQQYILTDRDGASDCYDMEQGLDVGWAHRVHWVVLPLSAKLASCKTQVPDDVHQYFYQHP